VAQLSGRNLPIAQDDGSWLGSSRLLAALYGPTSSGKTAMCVEIASRLERGHGRKVVIISADSRQVYRYMDIGTSKTTPEQMRGIRHEMLDVADPVRKFELEEYAHLARGHIRDALSTDEVPFVVGGTGVYIKALLDGWELDQVGAARSSLRRDFPPSMAEDAHAMLRRLDRRAAARVHPHNYTAVINALAALMASEDRATRPERVGLATVMLGLDPGPRALAKRVACTYYDQLRRGLFGEVLDLNDRYQLDTEMRRRGRGRPNQILHTHGYREYFQVAAEHGKNVADLTEVEHAEVGEQVVRHIRDYTGRQRTWFSKLPAVHMVDSPSQAYRLLTRALSGNA
jgi:tRNA dimethylallyltransferase